MNLEFRRFLVALAPVAFLTVGGLSAVPSDAQAKKVAVAVDATAEDQVGGRLVYALREGLRSSQGLTLVPQTRDSRVQVRIVTMDPDPATSPGHQTIYSAVWTVTTPECGPLWYWTNLVGTCGTNRIDQCAAGLVANTDKVAIELDEFVRSHPRRSGYLWPLSSSSCHLNVTT